MTSTHSWRQAWYPEGPGRGSAQKGRDLEKEPAARDTEVKKTRDGPAQAPSGTPQPRVQDAFLRGAAGHPGPV